jgi:hypothetical protein
VRVRSAPCCVGGVLLAVLLSSCGTQGTGIDTNTWVCTALAEEQYFQGYGQSREQAFQAAMDSCKMNSMQADECMGDPQRCMPPKGGS